MARHGRPRLVTPLAAHGRGAVGLAVCRGPTICSFTVEDTEIARAIAHSAAIAIKRAELIGQLTNANTVKDLFEALPAGATEFAATQGGRGQVRTSSSVS